MMVTASNDVVDREGADTRCKSQRLRGNLETDATVKLAPASDPRSRNRDMSYCERDRPDQPDRGIRPMQQMNFWIKVLRKKKCDCQAGNRPMNVTSCE